MLLEYMHVTEIPASMHLAQSSHRSSHHQFKQSVCVWWWYVCENSMQCVTNYKRPKTYNKWRRVPPGPLPNPACALLLHTPSPPAVRCRPHTPLPGPSPPAPLIQPPSPRGGPKGGYNQQWDGTNKYSIRPKKDTTRPKKGTRAGPGPKANPAVHNPPYKLATKARPTRPSRFA